MLQAESLAKSHQVHSQNARKRFMQVKTLLEPEYKLTATQVANALHVSYSYVSLVSHCKTYEDYQNVFKKYRRESNGTPDVTIPAVKAVPKYEFVDTSGNRDLLQGVVKKQSEIVEQNSKIIETLQQLLKLWQ